MSSVALLLSPGLGLALPQVVAVRFFACAPFIGCPEAQGIRDDGHEAPGRTRPARRSAAPEAKRGTRGKARHPRQSEAARQHQSVATSKKATSKARPD